MESGYHNTCLFQTWELLRDRKSNQSWWAFYTHNEFFSYFFVSLESKLTCLIHFLIKLFIKLQVVNDWYLRFYCNTKLKLNIICNTVSSWVLSLTQRVTKTDGRKTGGREKGICIFLLPSVCRHVKQTNFNDWKFGIQGWIHSKYQTEKLIKNVAKCFQETQTSNLSKRRENVWTLGFCTLCNNNKFIRKFRLINTNMLTCV